MLNKIEGCILGAAAGDALGAPGEGKSSAQIQELFGGRIDHFAEPPCDVPARGRKAGQVTDAFSIPYYLLEDIITAGGMVTGDIACRSLLRWGDSEYFEPFAGMTTRKAVIRMNESKHLNTWDRIGHLGNKLFKGHYYALSSNGAAVKAWPAALMSGSDEDMAIKLALQIALSSHDDVLSVSGACAAAAAVSCALGCDSNSGMYEVVNAALRGAEKGESMARDMSEICVYPGPSVVKRIEMAIEAALHASRRAEPADELRDLIGCGPAIAETVPTALGLLIAYGDDTLRCISEAASIGDETSAIASITGAVLGALRGAETFPPEWIEFLDRQNGIDIKRTAAETEETARKLSQL